MKRHILLYLSLLLMPFALQAQKSAYLSQIRVTDCQVQKIASGQIHLQLTLHFDSLQLGSQHALYIVPVLISADGTQQQAFQGIQLYGKQRYKIRKRAEVLSGTPLTQPGDQLHIYQKKNTLPLTYHTHAPFKRWMADSRLRIEALVEGCSQCNAGYETLLLNQTILPAPQWMPVFASVLPIPAEGKVHNDQHHTYIQFAQGSKAIRPALAGNETRLDSVVTVLKEMEADRNLSLKRIEVLGYASPEGAASFNQQLSARRAQSFADYLMRQMPTLDRTLFQIEGRGEAWGQLQQLLADGPLASSTEVSKQVQQALANPAQADAIDRQWRTLPIYSTLMQHYYPQLRRITYTVSYDVRPFNLSEARSLAQSHPQLLSAHEWQQVADSYLPDSLQYIETLQKAVKAQPQQAALAYNLAIALYQAQRPNEALPYLQASPSAEGYNLMGVIYMQMQQPEQAADAFRQAMEQGHRDAATNLKMMNDYIEFFKE